MKANTGILLLVQCGLAWSLIALLGCGGKVEDKSVSANSSGTAATNLPPGAELLAVVSQTIHGLEEHIRNKEITLVHNESVILETAMIPYYFPPSNWPALPTGMDPDGFLTSFGQLREEVSKTHGAADRSNQDELEKLLPSVSQRFEKFKALFPETTVKMSQRLAERYMCPMHPEVTGQRTNDCGKCGMELDQRVRLLPPNQSLRQAYTQTIIMSARADEPIRVGHLARIDVLLSKKNGAPVLVKDLIEAHTQKIHLLIIDGSLEDYHHEHPVPAVTPGVYSFSFTPRKPGPYRIWADLRPSPMGIQEYVVADIPAATQRGTLTNRLVNSSTTVDGLKYELTLASRKIRVGYPVQAKLRITSADGTGFAKLEPIMATFAHLVGFNEDYQTVLHLHPKGPPITDLTARGGPELEFQFFALKPGFVRLFAQVQIDGQSKFAPFGLVVAP